MAITPKGSEGTVEFGLCNVHYATVTETPDPQTGVISTTYGTIKSWAGAIKMTLNNKGSSNDSFADNGVWYTTISNPGYDGSFENFHVPQAVLTDLMGRVIDDDGAIVEFTEGRPAMFALMFEVDTDTVPTRYIYYKCQLSNINVEAETKTDSTTPKSNTASIRIMPRAEEDTVSGKKMHAIGKVCTATTDGTAYDAFFTTVQEPKFS